jgi:hypothetical protein
MDCVGQKPLIKQFQPQQCPFRKGPGPRPDQLRRIRRRRCRRRECSPRHLLRLTRTGPESRGPIRWRHRRRSRPLGRLEGFDFAPLGIAIGAGSQGSDTVSDILSVGKASNNSGRTGCRNRRPAGPVGGILQFIAGSVFGCVPLNLMAVSALGDVDPPVAGGNCRRGGLFGFCSLVFVGTDIDNSINYSRTSRKIVVKVIIEIISCIDSRACV